MPQEYLKLELTTTLKALQLDIDTIAVLSKATFKLAYMDHKKKYDALSRGQADDRGQRAIICKPEDDVQAVLDGSSKDSS